MSRVVIYCRDNAEGGQCVAIMRGGKTELFPITPREAIRLAAELTAYAWRMEQRKPPPD